MSAFSFGRNGVAARPASGGIAGRFAFAKNESAPGAGDGTIIDAAFANELVGNLRALLAAAGIASSDPGDNDKLRRAVEGLVYAAMAVRSAWSRGDWVADDSYVAGESVVYGGQIYICIEDHTSDVALPPGVEPESGVNPFQVLRWREDWAAGIAYEIGDAVLHYATFYICASAHVASAELPPGHTPAEGENPFLLFGGGYLNASEFTPSTVIEMLLGVDGTGSGLDADTLDGVHAAELAPLASPALTGAPTAPTADTSEDSDQLATTAFVHDVVEEAVLDAGAGDVVGPGSSTDGHAVVFDGATGKAVKSAGAAPHLAGGTDVPISDGGTGASTAEDARTNLGAQVAHALLTALAGLTPADGSLVGGNGTTFVMMDAAAVRAALGLAALALKATINNADWSGTDLAVANGGTGASDAPSARANLGAAAASHGHPQSDVTGLVAALAAKVETSLAINTTAPVTGGGALTGNRTIAVTLASQAEAEAGTINTKLMTPQRTAQAIAALASGPSMTPAALTDAATIAVDWSAAENFHVTVAGARTLGLPTNSIPGTRRRITATSSGTSRSISFAGNYKGDTGPINFPSSGYTYHLVVYCYSSTVFMIESQQAIGAI